jgi:hypothetical protein
LPCSRADRTTHRRCVDLSIHTAGNDECRNDRFAERASDIILGRDEPEEERRLSEENEGTRLATTDSSMAGTATH